MLTNPYFRFYLLYSTRIDECLIPFWVSCLHGCLGTTFTLHATNTKGICSKYQRKFCMAYSRTFRDRDSTLSGIFIAGWALILARRDWFIKCRHRGVTLSYIVVLCFKYFSGFSGTPKMRAAFLWDSFSFPKTNTLTSCMDTIQTKNLISKGMTRDLFFCENRLLKPSQRLIGLLSSIYSNITPTFCRAGSKF